jgi:hypothetical protein
MTRRAPARGGARRAPARVGGRRAPARGAAARRGVAAGGALLVALAVTTLAPAVPRLRGGP